MSDGFDPILQQAEQRRLREQVLWRLGIAAGLIAVVLGGIYLLDRPDEKPQLETPTTPRIAPQISEEPVPPTEQPAAQASEPATASAPASVPAAASPAPSAAPTPTAATSSTPPPTSKPISGKVPARTATVAPPPAASLQTVAPTQPATPAAAQPVNTPPRATATAQAAPRRNSQAETLLQPQNLLAGPAAADAVRGPNGYTVQAGVFLHSDNAEKLLKRVQAAGIPAYLETRVQIGPFKNKAEADAAAARLRAIGVEPVLKNN
ncbi:Cell division protein FtsN [Andreprevotia sp. IGB-42]|uniref:SPOR domain-containing protein n=1 Tax=Andreprevotia sp. IGB-42 TaxID=2497473 RepID=UPI0013598BEA|nr:SPOR domain-containing protein [Andreprevotia sp. IGB-42]KAF0814333.1 Cell division protein FtsN [Andreprevotia sp. IGB-42]